MGFFTIFHHIYWLAAAATILLAFNLARASHADSFRPIFFALVAMILTLAPYGLEHIAGGIGYSRLAASKFAVVELGCVLLSLLTVYFGIQRAKPNYGRKNSIAFVIGRDLLLLIVISAVIFHLGGLERNEMLKQGAILFVLLLSTKKGSELATTMTENTEKSEAMNRIGNFTIGASLLSRDRTNMAMGAATGGMIKFAASKGGQTFFILLGCLAMVMTGVETVYNGTEALVGDEVSALSVYVQTKIVEPTDNVFFEGQYADIFEWARAVLRQYTK
ncbi:hypothetical protein [Vibrio crassostreae]|uniref:hypothetical protein n=1 Tax=Vibrio crassostreae TaxID=246167 RepID=UPI001B30988B|nr:hypothetical protein [Vibrio crassostreae]